MPKAPYYQHDFSLNIWVDLIDIYLIGPVVLPRRLNGATFWKLNYMNC